MTPDIALARRLALTHPRLVPVVATPGAFCADTEYPRRMPAHIDAWLTQRAKAYPRPPLDPDGEPWAIDPDLYRRLHRPAVTGRPTRRRRWPRRALAWCWRKRADAALAVIVALAIWGAYLLMDAGLRAGGV